MSKPPHAPGSWQHALGTARAALRCGARCKRTGLACEGPSMPNGRCRMHGGASTGPRTAEGIARCTAGPTKHGRRNAGARARAADRGKARAAVAALRRLLTMAQAGHPGIEPDELLDLMSRAGM